MMAGSFGDKLRRVRYQVGLTQGQLADLSGISRSWLAEIEGGSEPRLSVAIAIAQALQPYGIDSVALLLGEVAVDRREHMRRALNWPVDARVPNLDFERLAESPVDHRLLDGLQTVATAHAKLRPVFGPGLLHPMIRSHLEALKGLIDERSASTSVHCRLVSIASGVAALAAWTSMTLDRRSDARAYLEWAESAAREVGDQESLMLILLLHADLVSPIPSGGLEGYPKVALDKLGEVRSLATSTTPAALRVPPLVRMSEEHAFMRQAHDSYAALEEGDRLFASLENRDYYLREAWQATSGILTAFRGHCLSLLGESAEAIKVIEPTVKTARFGGTRSARTADLAAAHAELGDVDRACELLEQSLDHAVGIGEVEKARRVAGIRRRYLARWASDPAVVGLDERLATIL